MGADFFLFGCRENRDSVEILPDFVQFYLTEWEVEFFWTGFERIRSRNELRATQLNFFFADIQRRGRKNSFPAASVYSFLGRNAPIDFEKLNGFGRIGPAARDFFCFFSKKNHLKGINMARQS